MTKKLHPLKLLFIKSHYEYCNKNKVQLQLKDLAKIINCSYSTIRQKASAIGNITNKHRIKNFYDGNRYKVNENGCWIWQLSLDSRNRYGAVGDKYGVTTAHKFYYEQKYGKVKDGLELDHLCLNLRCCNPDHLEPVTGRENIARRYGKSQTKLFEIV